MLEYLKYINHTKFCDGSNKFTGTETRYPWRSPTKTPDKTVVRSSVILEKQKSVLFHRVRVEHTKVGVRTLVGKKMRPRKITFNFEYSVSDPRYRDSGNVGEGYLTFSSNF